MYYVTYILFLLFPSWDNFVEVYTQFVIIDFMQLYWSENLRCAPFRRDIFIVSQVFRCVPRETRRF